MSVVPPPDRAQAGSNSVTDLPRSRRRSGEVEKVEGRWGPGLAGDARAMARWGPVLVVEPGEQPRSLLAVGLSRAGFETLAARTLEEAREHLRPNRALPAMVVCEADLEGDEDGFRFREELRADPRTAHLPVLLLVDRPEAFFLEMASGPAGDDHLPKPAFLEDVVTLVKLKAGQPASQLVLTTDTDTLPLGELVRALLAEMRSGQIEMVDGSARLAFRQGQVVDAKLEGVRGARALSRMLLLARGPCTVTYGPALELGTLSLDLRELCRVVLPDLLRARRTLERALPLEAVLRIDASRLSEVLPDLPDSVNGLVRLYDGKRTLREVILRSELPESSALLVTTRLYGLGAIEPLLPPPPSANDPEVAGSVAVAPVARIVEVVHFAPRPREPRSIQQAVSVAADTMAALPAPSPRRRKLLVSLAAGAMALLLAVVLAPALARTTAVSEPSANSVVARVPALPEWLAPHALGTADDWVTLGVGRYDAGDLAGARGAVAHALALDPRHGRALLLLATIHYREGERDEARTALRRYLAADPQGELADEARALLSR